MYVNTFHICFLKTLHRKVTRKALLCSQQLPPTPALSPEATKLKIKANRSCKYEKGTSALDSTSYFIVASGNDRGQILLYNSKIGLEINN
jgi:hypothetical protein